MTSAQTSLYWREFGAVKKRYLALHQPPPDRHELHAQALGQDKSSKAFTNEDLDKVLAVFRGITHPESVDDQMRQLDQPAARLRYACRAIANDIVKANPHTNGSADAYLRKILLDRWNTLALDDLDLAQLTQLRNTLSARRRSKLKTAQTQPKENCPF